MAQLVKESAHNAGDLGLIPGLGRSPGEDPLEKISWRREWQPTPVFLPGESQGRGSLVGFRLWGRAESDMTDMT